jgi:hypothetical protein
MRINVMWIRNTGPESGFRISESRIYNICCEFQACSCEGEHMFCRECMRRGCEAQLGGNQRRMVCFNQACRGGGGGGGGGKRPLAKKP